MRTCTNQPLASSRVIAALLCFAKPSCGDTRPRASIDTRGPRWDRIHLRDLESTSAMASEAAITDSQLLERLMLSDEAFVDYFLELVSHFPAREWTRRSFEHGLRYPWTRPDRSYLLRDGETDLLHELGEAERAAVLERHLEPAAERVALLAFGANVAPKNLAVKLAHHAEIADREVLV